MSQNQNRNRNQNQNQSAGRSFLSVRAIAKRVPARFLRAGLVCVSVEPTPPPYASSVPASHTLCRHTPKSNTRCLSFQLKECESLACDFGVKRHVFLCSSLGVERRYRTHPEIQYKKPQLQYNLYQECGFLYGVSGCTQSVTPTASSPLSSRRYSHWM
eukprot:1905295-Rhodomonas_salina.1